MSRSRRLLLLLLPALLLLSLQGWQAPGAAAAAVWPVEPVVVLRDFTPPELAWEPGHRGVDLAAEVGDPVVAPAAGTVSFAARLAGRGVVVVSLPGGLRTTLEPVRTSVVVGDPVLAGDLLGTVEPGPHCGWTPCVHWGLRREDAYLDPRTLLGLVPPVLLPLAAGPTAPGDEGPPSGVTPPPLPGDGATGFGSRGSGWVAAASAAATVGPTGPAGDGSVPADRRRLQLLGGLGQLAP